MAKTEKRRFNMHPKLLYDVIFNQAGTLAKAIMEGVMNSVDAKATECRITLSPERLTISDDGTGITTKAHIEEFFETFGQPHSEEERKTFGRFRMGRGQLFKYGVNTWETGKFKMVVDAKEKGLDYDLTEYAKDVVKKGCRIAVELYEELLPSALDETTRTLQMWCKYAPIKLYWNDELVSVDPAKEKWDHVLPEAYISLKATGSLAIYNLGVHTMEIAGYRFGTGGIVVSRKQLQVNFARNDVQDSCPVWRKIKPFIDQKATEKISKKATLTDDERQRLADQIRLGTVDANTARDAKVITLVNGRHFDISDLYSYSSNHRVTSCKKGDVLGDKLHQRRMAAVVADTTLERFHVKTLPELLQFYLRYPSTKHYAGDVKYVDMSQLTKGMDRNYILLDKEQYTPNERMWMQLIECNKHKLELATQTRDKLRESGNWKEYYTNRPSLRKVSVGKGPADGWTDGETYVAINRAFLGTLHFNTYCFYLLGRLLLHEFCHAEPSSATHVHTPEFYQLFHDSSPTLADFVHGCFGTLPKIVKELKRKPNRAMLYDQDRVAAVEAIDRKKGAA